MVSMTMVMKIVKNTTNVPGGEKSPSACVQTKVTRANLTKTTATTHERGGVICPPHSPLTMSRAV